MRQAIMDSDEYESEISETEFASLSSKLSQEPDIRVMPLEPQKIQYVTF
jgi:hypothetical protein